MVTINAVTSAAPGATLASVAPTRCSPTPNFIIPGVIGANTLYTTQLANAATITFTPRGSVLLSNNAVDAVVRIFLNGSTLVRCVKTSAGLGFVRIGANNSAANTSSDCALTSYQAF